MLKAKTEIVQLLLCHGIDINIGNDKGETPLQAARKLKYKGGVYKVIMGLLEPFQRISHILCTLLLLYSWMVGIGYFPVEAAGSTQAILQGNLQEVEAVIAAGASLEQLDPYGGTPLHLAVHNGDIAIAELLLERGAHVNAMVNPHFPIREEEELEEVKQDYIRAGADIGAIANFRFSVSEKEKFKKLDLDGYGGTPLHIAVAKGNMPMVKLLVAHGAILNSHSWDGPYLVSHRTPLMVAVRRGHSTLVKWLLKQGASVNDGDDESFTALHEALKSGFNMVKLLIDHGAYVNSKSAYGNVLSFASYTTPQVERKQIMELLIKQGARFDSYLSQDDISYMLQQGASLDCKDSKGNTPLHAAVQKGTGCRHKGDDLFKSGRGHSIAQDNLYAAASYNDRSWFQAILAGDLEKVRKGISEGMSVNQLSRKNLVPLHIEVYMGYPRDPYKKVRITHGYTPLHLAAFQGNIVLTKFLLAKGASINAIDMQHGYTPLHLAACQGHAKVVKLLLTHKALMDVRDKHLGRTPLHLATATGNRATVECLINQGATMDSRDRDSWTSLHLAIVACNAVEIIQLLIDKGAIMDQEDTPLHLAAKLKDAVSMRYLIQKGADVNATNKKGKTPLHMACYQYSDGKELVEFLLTKGAGLHVRNNQGRTPLHLAAYNGLTETIQLLFAHGVNVNDTDYKGNTCLHLINRSLCISNALNVINLLIKHGADVHCKNKSGKTPLDLAIQNKTSNQIITLLKEKGKAV